MVNEINVRYNVLSTEICVVCTSNTMKVYLYLYMFLFSNGFRIVLIITDVYVISSKFFSEAVIGLLLAHKCNLIVDLKSLCLNIPSPIWIEISTTSVH